MALPTVSPTKNPAENFAALALAIQILDQINTAFGGKVDRSELNALGVVVSGKADFADFQTLGNTVSNKAEQADLVALADRVDGLGITNLIAQLRSDLTTAITSGLRTKADVTALQAARESLNALATIVAGKADGSTFAAFTANVNALTNAIQVRVAQNEAQASLTASDLIARVTAAVAAARTVTAHQVDALSRLGDGPQAFTRGLVGGEPAALTPLSGADVVLGDEGATVRMRGPDLISTRRAVAIERGRAYRVRIAFQRTANVSDPAGDAVRFGILWLDRAKNPISGAAGTSVVKDLLQLSVSDGMLEVQTVIGRSKGGPVQIQAPNRARYARAFFQTFGADGTTELHLLDIADVTDAALFPPAAADLAGRVSQLESGDYGERLSVLEGQSGGAFTVTFRTLSDAQAGTVPAPVTMVRLLGQATAGDGGSGDYRRVAALVSSEAGFRTADGAYWRLVTELRGSITPALFRVRGDGVTDDTAGMQAFVDLGGMLFVPDGDYLVDGLNLTKQTYLVLSPKARLLQRSGGAVSRNLIHGVGAGPAGSVIQGGILDGRRAVLGFSYPNLPRGDPGYVVWEGIRFDFTPDVTLRDIVFQNFAVAAFRVGGCERFKASGIKVRSCGQAFGVQGVSSAAQPYTSGNDVEVDARDIGNRDETGRDYAIFQHASEARFLRNSRIKARILNFSGNKVGLEPLCIAFGFDSCDRTHFDLVAEGYSGDLPHVGAIFNSHRSCTMDLKTSGLESGLQVISGLDSTIHVDIDGKYFNVAGYPREGLIFTPGGVFPISAAGLAGETSANLVAQNITVTGRVMRSGIGIRIEGGGGTFMGVQSIGNDREGWQIVKSAQASISFPGGAGRKRRVSRTKLIACSARGNGNDGLIATAGDDVEIIGGDFNNNGQDPNGFSHNAINLLAEAGEIRNWVIADVDLDDTSDTAEPGAFTYAPGATTNDTYRIDVLNPNEYDLGEYVFLRGVLAGGGDALGRIIDRLADIVVLRFDGPKAFLMPAANLRGIGQGSTTGNKVNVPGGGLITGPRPILFRNYLKHSSRDEYRQIVYVDSDTHAVIDTPFTSDVPAGSALSVVEGRIDGHSRSQTQALLVGGTVAGPLLIKGLRHKNLRNFFNFPSLGAVASGSEFRATYEVDLSNQTDVQAIVSGLPAGMQIVRAETTILTPIGGISADTRGTFRLFDAGVASFDFPAIAALSALPVGAKTTLHVPNSPAFQSDGGAIGLVLTGGADNVPTGGSLFVDLTVRRI